MSMGRTVLEAESNAAAPPRILDMLRVETKASHKAVDAAFGRFALDTPNGYRDFLTAQARILPVAERIIDPGSLLPGWRGRTGALEEDLAALGQRMPAEFGFALPKGDGARWGALYVLEGSRLGGAVLVRRVAAGLPTGFLGACYRSGAWRALLDALDAADTGALWQAEAVDGAKRLFCAYLSAASASTGGHSLHPR